MNLEDMNISQVIYKFNIFKFVQLNREYNIQNKYILQYMQNSRFYLKSTHKFLFQNIPRIKSKAFKARNNFLEDQTKINPNILYNNIKNILKIKKKISMIMIMKIRSTINLIIMICMIQNNSNNNSNKLSPRITRIKKNRKINIIQIIFNIKTRIIVMKFQFQRPKKNKLTNFLSLMEIMISTNNLYKRTTLIKAKKIKITKILKVYILIYLKMFRSHSYIILYIYISIIFKIYI